MTRQGWVFDLDGVVWLDDQPIDGAAEAVTRVQRAGHATLFVTNMSRRTIAYQEAKLGRHGIAAVGQVVTSAMAGAALVEPGERVLVVGGEGLREAVADRGGVVAETAPIDAVLVGMDPAFGYADLKAASLAVRAGARLIASNEDPTFPTPEGLVPGAGAIVAAIETATSVRAVVAGKPHEPAAALVRARLGPSGVVVGDRPETDGLFAQTLGYDFALVLSGVTGAADLPVEPEPSVVAPDLGALVDALVG